MAAQPGAPRDALCMCNDMGPWPLAEVAQVPNHWTQMDAGSA